MSAKTVFSPLTKRSFRCWYELSDSDDDDDEEKYNSPTSHPPKRMALTSGSESEEGDHISQSTTGESDATPSTVLAKTSHPPKWSSHDKSGGVRASPNWSLRDRVNRIGFLATDRKRRNETHMRALCRAIALLSIEEVTECLEQLLESTSCTVNQKVKIKAVDGRIRQSNPMLKWAEERYESELYRKINIQKPFLIAMQDDSKKMDEDASEILRMLLESGADPHARWNDTGQTPLHSAMAEGYSNCVKALIDQVPYDLNALAQKDVHGDSVIHSALQNGNFYCAEIILFPQQQGQFGDSRHLPSTQELLNNIEDYRGDNIIAALVRYTDLPYDSPSCIKRGLTSPSFDLLNKIVSYLTEINDFKPLLQKNKFGENAVAIAAKCGTLHELRLLNSVKFMDKISIANICTQPTEFSSSEVNSPLDLANKTKEIIKSNLMGEGAGGIEDFDLLGICGCNAYVDDKKKMECWRKSVTCCISHLKNIQKTLRCDMKLVQEQRQAMNARRFQKSRFLNHCTQVCYTQKLTTEAMRQKKIMTKHSPRAQESKILNFPHDFKVTRKKFNETQSKVLNLLKNPGPAKCVYPGILRNPKDPCFRASTRISLHFGLFASKQILKDTIIMEYAGLVRRENEGMYQINPEYAVKLGACDEHILNHQVKGKDIDYSNAYILDGEWLFNEGSLINDHRWSLAGEESVLHRDVNAKFLEVVVNGWPHIFIISTKNISKDEELLIDYGPEYWEKILNERLNEKLAEREKEIAEMKRKASV